MYFNPIASINEKFSFENRFDRYTPGETQSNNLGGITLLPFQIAVLDSIS